MVSTTGINGLSTPDEIQAATDRIADQVRRLLRETTFVIASRGVVGNRWASARTDGAIIPYQSATRRGHLGLQYHLTTPQSYEVSLLRVRGIGVGCPQCGLSVNAQKWMGCG